MPVFHLSYFQIWSYFSGPTGFSKSLLYTPKWNLLHQGLCEACRTWNPTNFPKKKSSPTSSSLKHPGTRCEKNHPTRFGFTRRIQGTRRHECWCSSTKWQKKGAFWKFRIVHPVGMPRWVQIPGDFWIDLFVDVWAETFTSHYYWEGINSQFGWVCCQELVGKKVCPTYG